MDRSTPKPSHGAAADRSAREPTMPLPVTITFRNLDHSPALEQRIRKLVERLGRFSRHIQRCDIVIQPPAHHQHHGGLHDFRVHITLPEEQIAIHRARRADQAHEDVYVALRDAFRAARRRLEDYERRRWQQRVS
jgi:ribosomal subunit interface protein